MSSSGAHLPPAPLCSIIIPVFERSGLTRQCLDQLLALPRGASHEIVVIDDGSKDDTQKVVCSFGSRVRSICLDRNQGFASACNRGATEAKGQYVVFLNNDTAPSTGWLDELLDAAAHHPRAAAVGARLLYAHGPVQHAGIAIGADLRPWALYGGFPADHPAVRRSRHVTAVTGACLLAPREVFLELGGFDESFRNGYEDVDYCLRARDAGFEIWYCAESVVHHLESASGEPRYRFLSENDQCFRSRWSHRLRPDDHRSWASDGLLELGDGPGGPQRWRISPRLAVVEVDDQELKPGNLLRQRMKQIHHLRRENVERRATDGLLGTLKGLGATGIAQVPVRGSLRDSGRELRSAPVISDLLTMLLTADRKIEGFSDVLALGFPTRSWLRSLRAAVRGKLSAVDPRIVEVAEARRSVEGVDVRLTDSVPPLPFRQGRFDLVLADVQSIDFSHSASWVAELERVTNASGTLVLTAGAEDSWSRTLASASAGALREIAEIDSERTKSIVLVAGQA